MIDSLNWLDIVILLPLVVGLVRGIMRGMVDELIGIAAIVLGIIGARIWGSSILSYLAIFVCIALLLRIAGYFLHKAIQASKLSWINRILGGICGVCKWAMIMLVVVFAMGQADQQLHVFTYETKQNSIVYQYVLDKANHIWKTKKQHQS